MTSAPVRKEQLDALGYQESVSVLIVGGGINGAGLFRELALQGVDVLLIEKSDFCGGASAAATRVIHGGLRYIENGELRLVRESLGERNRLLANAPHYVKPLAITIPIFHRATGMLNAVRTFLGSPTKAGDRGALAVKIGLTLYDLLAHRSRALPRHRFRWKKDASNLHPGLHPDTIGAATFYDAAVSFAERLCLELLLDAERGNSRAMALNYAGLEDASGESVRFRDQLTGRLYSIKPRIVVNATGAWIDFTNRALGRETQFIGGTKGSHVVLDHPDLLAAAGGGMIYFANSDGRICIFYQFFGRVIAGATDIPVTDPGAAVCDEAEVEYILDSIRQVLPAIRVNRSHVVFQFCGVRPLPRSSAASPGQVTRDYSYPVVPADGAISFPVYSLVGGKWTTFRALAERVANELLRELGRTRQCDTRDLPIGGGEGFPAGREEQERWLNDLRQRTGLPRERLRTLLDRYGAAAEGVSEFLGQAPDRDLERTGAYTQREIEFLATREKVMHLDDLVLRRTLLGLLGQVDGPTLRELAAVLGSALGWTEDRIVEEIARTAALLTRVHGVDERLLNP